MVDAEKTELEIDNTRSKYIPVATRTQLLFFCTTDLSNIDPMYQYSLEWFISIFLNSIASAERAGMYTYMYTWTCMLHACHVQYTDMNAIFAADDLEERIENINEYFTFSLYSNVCRSLFEQHKLLFSFLLCVRILQNDNKMDMVCKLHGMYMCMYGAAFFIMSLQSHILRVGVWHLCIQVYSTKVEL